MKNLFLALLLVGLLRPPVRASQIVVGLRSDNLVSWSLWKRQAFGLKHYLLLYNKGAQAIDVRLKLRRFASDGSRFTDSSPGRALGHRRLGAGQLIWLPYPRKLSGRDFAEFFENNASIGLLPGSPDRPPPTVPSKQFCYYTDQGADAHRLGYWLALDSLHALPRRLALTAAHRFPAPDETLKEEYHLVKLYPDFKGTWPLRPGTLDSLAVGDVSITRFDRAHPGAVVPVPAALAAPGFSRFVICIEQVNDGYRYDEAKRLVPDKSFGGTLCFIPVFPPASR